MDEIDYTYNEKFEGNIFVVGRTGCKKTTFVLNLGKNKISKIELSAKTEDSVKDCFNDQIVDFKYPSSAEDFNNLLEIYKRKKSDRNENYLVENTILDRVIVMDDVSGLANKSKEFAVFFYYLEIWSDVYIHFSYNLPNKKILANDTIRDKDI